MTTGGGEVCQGGGREATRSCRSTSMRTSRVPSWFRVEVRWSSRFLAVWDVRVRVSSKFSWGVS